MKIECLKLGLYETNCYVISDENGVAAVTDPGYFPEQVLEFLNQRQLKLGVILLTHGHFDHVGGVKAIAEATGCAVYINEKELTMPSYMTAGELHYTNAYDEGDCVRVGQMEFKVMATPGHSPGSVCLICGNAMFTGDTLFCGSCGRTDCSGGSWAQILESLKRLAQLEENYDVYPGHGTTTTLLREQRGNRFVLEALRR